MNSLLLILIMVGIGMSMSAIELVKAEMLLPGSTEFIMFCTRWNTLRFGKLGSKSRKLILSYNVYLYAVKITRINKYEYLNCYVNLMGNIGNF